MTEYPTRKPFPPDFPLVVVHQRRSSPLRLKADGYKGAKAGGPAAAALVAARVVSLAAVQELRTRFSAANPILAVPFSLSRNLVPLAIAEAIAEYLGLEVDCKIVQASTASRTGRNAAHRLFTRISFNGAIESGRNYLLVDDVVVQGGTFADLRGHIEAGGGRVVGATAIISGARSRRLQISVGTLERLRRLVGHLETAWSDAFGFDFASLTESEGNNLHCFAYWHPRTIGHRIAEAGKKASFRGSTLRT